MSFTWTTPCRDGMGHTVIAAGDDPATRTVTAAGLPEPPGPPRRRTQGSPMSSLFRRHTLAAAACTTLVLSLIHI